MKQIPFLLEVFIALIMDLSDLVFAGIKKVWRACEMVAEVIVYLAIKVVLWLYANRIIVMVLSLFLGGLYLNTLK